MDNRRLDTGQVLALGIPYRPIPVTDIPKGREKFDTRESAELSAADALDSGKLLYVPEYYGIVAAWKDDAGYHWRLLQYRAVSEAPDFTAADACAAWFSETVDAVTG